MNYGVDKLVIDAYKHTDTDRETDAGNGNTRKPKLASDKKLIDIHY